MPVEIPLTQSKVAVVDDGDAALVAGFSWVLRRRGKIEYAGAYVRGSGNKAARYVYMHRIVASAPRGLEVDHIDGDGLNNTRANLRLCTRAQNARNRHGTWNRHTQYKGAYFNPKTGKWIARLTSGGRNLHLGVFDNAYDAACEYDMAASSIYGEYANINFPWLWGDAQCQ